MRTEILVAVIVIAAGAILLPTLASPLGDDVDTELHDDIEMSPADGPNGIYATLDENDEIAIEITEERMKAADAAGGTGVNDGTITQIDGVFEIAYTGEEDDAHVWLDETDIEGVTFYVGTDPENTIEGEENNVSLGENEIATVGILIDTTADDHAVEEITDFTVNADVPETDSQDAAVSLTEGTISPSFDSVLVNESALQVGAEVSNTGQTTADETVSLLLDGEEVAQQEITVSGTETKSLEFSENVSLTAGDEIELTLETAAESVVMTTAVEGDADLDIEFTETTATESEVNASAMVSNHGDQPVSETATYSVNGTTLDEPNLSLAAGESTSIAFAHELNLTPETLVELSLEAETANATELVTVEDDEQMVIPTFETVNATEQGVTATVHLENTGSEMVNDSAVFAVADEVVDSIPVSLEVNETETVSLEDETELQPSDTVTVTIAGEDGHIMESNTTVQVPTAEEEPAEGDLQTPDASEETSSGEADDDPGDEEDATISALDSDPLEQTVGEFTTTTILILALSLGIGGAGATALRLRFAGAE